MSKNAEGWIRHNSKQQPVDNHVEVEIRTRGGDYEVCKASGFTWDATAENQIMAYRLHKPAEQVEACSKPDPRDSAKRDSDYVCWMRDRITEIDATAHALTTERAELVQKLASEGVALIGRINELLTDSAQKHEDMSNPKFWRDGDMVEILSSTNFAWKRWKGMTGRVEIEEDNMAPKIVFGCGEYWRANKNCTFRWHSRPSA